jgi:hypothetical protein
MVSKHIEGCLKIILSYLAYNRIWLNLPVGHCNFGYFTKLKKLKIKMVLGTKVGGGREGGREW